MEHRIDAQNKILGRLASDVARLLMGKDKPSYDRARLFSSRVIVFNVSGIRVTGKKPKQKLYRRHSGYLGGLKEISYEELFKRSPAEVLRKAVSGMLPKNKLRVRMLKNLVIYKGNINE